jgi:hypothetical protein
MGTHAMQRADDFIQSLPEDSWLLGDLEQRLAKQAFTALMSGRSVVSVGAELTESCRGAQSGDAVAEAVHEILVERGAL